MRRRLDIAYADKTHGFSDDHDETKPAQVWFQESEDGLVLFIVLYSMACRWGKCIGCNLPSKCASHYINFDAIMHQIDRVVRRKDVSENSDRIQKVILSNNGSVLDEETFPMTALVYFVAMANRHFRNMHTLTIESRPEYVDSVELEVLRRVMREGNTSTQLEIAIGFEIFNSHLRNDIFQKGLYLDQFEEFAATLARFKDRLKCYFMQKPVPEMSDQEALQDVRSGIDYLSEISKRYGLKINMHLNPTYAARGTVLGEAFKKGIYSPPQLSDVAKAVRYAQRSDISIYVGLSDEGLAVPGGSFIRPGDEFIIKRLDMFNRTQDYSLLNGK